MTYPIWDLLEEVYMYELSRNTFDKQWAGEVEGVEDFDFMDYLTHTGGSFVRQDWSNYHIEAGLSFLEKRGWLEKEGGDWSVTAEGMELLNRTRMKEAQQTSNSLLTLLTYALVMITLVEVASRITGVSGIYGMIYPLVLIGILYLIMRGIRDAGN